MNDRPAIWPASRPAAAASSANAQAKPKAKRERQSESQATLLVKLAEEAELWHTSGQGDAWATIAADGHCEHWPVRSRALRRWLSRRFFVGYGKAPGGQALQDALSVIEGQALFEGAEHATYMRVAEHDGRLYLDLADARWRAIEVDAGGWRVVEGCPVRFRRAKAMQSLPEPTSGGDIAELRRFVNVTDDDWPLVLGWLVASLRPTGPYPVLALHGEQGAAKTTTARVLRAMVDPNAAPVRCEPRDARDLAIAANNGWLIALDNLSYVPTWLSDALCRLATGGGFSTRTLYENDEETIFDATRPVILTGIEEVATRGDLLDRCILISLPTIPERQRLVEAELWRAVEEALPRLLGALLDAAAMALRELPTTQLERLPRMADFALWATAAEAGLGLRPGEFLARYSDNRAAANETALESSPVAAHIVALAQAGGWEGTASELLEQLERLASERDRQAKTWPRSARGLSGVLKRLAPNLRAAGVDVEFTRDADRQRRRRICIRTVGEYCVRTVRPSDDTSRLAALGESRRTVAGSGELDASDAKRTQNNGCGRKSDANAIDVTRDGAILRTVADDADARTQPRSNPGDWVEVTL